MPSAAHCCSCSSYPSPASIALPRIVGFDVTPRMPSSLTSFASSPFCSSGRDRLSYHGLCPKSFSFAIALDITSPDLWSTLLRVVRTAVSSWLRDLSGELQHLEGAFHHVVGVDPELVEHGRPRS